MCWVVKKIQGRHVASHPQWGRGKYVNGQNGILEGVSQGKVNKTVSKSQRTVSLSLFLISTCL